MKFFALCFALTITPASASTPEESPELASAFENAGVSGTFVMLNAHMNTLMVHNPDRAKHRLVPASTFKIVNSLIGLDCGAVADAEEVLPYGGGPQFLKEWERDMSLREAMPLSNVPVYQELARRVGVERMQAGLDMLNYGNREIGDVIDRFWLDGPLKISAIEQVQFLQRLITDELPVSKEATETVRRITFLEDLDGVRLHGKTGWAMSLDPQVGWFVGWIETRDGKFPFALNIHIAVQTDGAKRVPLAKECLRLLGLL